MADQPEINAAGAPGSPSGAPATAFSDWGNPQIGFFGNAKAKLDERGRLKLPVEFKAVVEKKYGEGFNAFYITSLSGEDAEIYPMPEWQQHLARLFSMPSSEDARMKVLEADSLFGDRVEMDSQGRLLLPEELRNRGMVNQDVRISGHSNKLRVVSLERLRASVAKNPVEKEDRQVLARYGL